MPSTSSSKDVTARAGTTSDKAKHHDGGWRETIESLAMAVILALLFKGYVAEAFVIPTGSMAPTLQGRHKDVSCPECGYQFQTTASDEVDRAGFLTGNHVISGTCPVCRFTHTYDPRTNANEGSFSGDRIIVSKFAYEIAEPKRWDVIVFKFPEDAAQNYIKRLVGLPGEQLLISGGNIFTRPAASASATPTIARKPPHKLTAMLQIVDDSSHIPESLQKIGWPPRWREWSENGTGTDNWSSDDGGRSFTCKPATETSWLRYRHLTPTYADWQSITVSNRLPPDVALRRGQLITDLYAYNTSVYIDAGASGWAPDPGYYRTPLNSHVDYDRVPDRLKSTDGRELLYDPSLVGPGIPCSEEFLGNHWVDDLALECLADIKDSQGSISLDLVRAGVHQRCTINVQDGKATLSRMNAVGKALPFVDSEKKEISNPTAMTAVKGAGIYRLRLTNCDHEVMLFVNGKPVKFDQPTTYESNKVVAPQWTSQDPLDLEPAAVGTSCLTAKVSQLRIFRDKYYIAINYQSNSTADYTTLPPPPPGEPFSLQRIFATPEEWQSSGLFDPANRRLAEFTLEDDEFFPMGDNSPSSSDGRYWHPEDYLTRDLLIGKALVIYWPHSWNRPMFWPNFKRMGPIR
ncbi:signal peptidase I [Anatilimnocola aggregata]|nr:signal peptidase I [Anatilimnocola aggregata]